MLSGTQIQEIRSRFPILKRCTYLNSCSQGLLSDAVEGALREYTDTWHKAGSPWELWVQKYNAVRGEFARFIGAEPEEVAVVSNASAGINSIASALEFKERRKVVMGEFEFPTMGHVWLAQRQRGAQVDFLAAKEERIDPESYARAVDDRTVVVPVAHISFLNGFRSDVAQITQIAHAKGAFVFMDDYQDCGTRPVDVKALNVDFYVAGTLKYLLASSGVAFLYVRKELIQSLTPTISGWFTQVNPYAFDVKHMDLSPAAKRFEDGTPSIPSIYMASAGMALLQEIGLENIAAHVRTLAQALIHGAREMGIYVKTPPVSVGPLVVLKSTNVEAVMERLAKQDIIVSGRRDGIRIAFHAYNTLDDVRQVLEALKKSCFDLMVSTEQHV